MYCTLCLTFPDEGVVNEAGVFVNLPVGEMTAAMMDSLKYLSKKGEART